jgi:N-acetylglucosamine kinase-like BadF-type ATPase
MIIVGIDGGGTKTHGLALDDQGTVTVRVWAALPITILSGCKTRWM